MVATNFCSMDSDLPFRNRMQVFESSRNGCSLKRQPILKLTLRWTFQLHLAKRSEKFEVPLWPLRDGCAQAVAGTHGFDYDQHIHFGVGYSC